MVAPSSHCLKSSTAASFFSVGNIHLTGIAEKKALSHRLRAWTQRNVPTKPYIPKSLPGRAHDLTANCKANGRPAVCGDEFILL